MLPTPSALLLDFGGVIVESGRSTEPLRELVDRVHRLVGGALSTAEIHESLERADDVRSERRDTSTDFVELSHEQLWGELVAAEWPAVARATVLVHAGDLTRQWARRPDWRLRPGMADLLDFTIGLGMPVAVVSNTRSGQAHRDILDELGVTGAFAVQVYSDELGVFKPHPSMIWAAARELGVAAAACWFVGDQLSKDIVCARRAGTGAAILMPHGDSPQKGDGSPETTPDAVVADGTELLALLRQSL
ncbi:HAD family hydrolase [Catellatospora sp. NPDC049111]|uniref:HAD family hydrolase n=1 Tax=Catellatospora sp. NPDC049111 TaxID=3155271 RepID=UPI00340F76FA